MGCSRHDAQPGEFQPSRPASQPAPSVSALPVDIEVAISVLSSNRQDEAAVQKATQALHAFETSVVLVEETLQNVKTGEYSKEVTHRFPKAGVDVTYRDGKVLGLSRITKEAGASNQPSDSTR